MIIMLLMITMMTLITITITIIETTSQPIGDMTDRGAPRRAVVDVVVELDLGFRRSYRSTSSIVLQYITLYCNVLFVLIL